MSSINFTRKIHVDKNGYLEEYLPAESRMGVLKAAWKGLGTNLVMIKLLRS